MIKKLQRSFVRVTMLSAALVLVILMGIVNVSNYVQRNGTDAEILQILAENGGHFPGENKGGKNGRPRFITEETPYESRYFSVFLSEDGSFVIKKDGKARICGYAPDGILGYADVVVKGGKIKSLKQ